MKSKYVMVLTILVGLSLLCGQSAQANSVPAVSLPGTPPSSHGTPTVEGWGFTVDSSVTVSALGVWDYGLDGLLASHQVAIWSVPDQQLQVSATVPSGTAGTLIDIFRYVDLGTPVTLTAGDYRIAALFGSSDRHGGASPAPSLAPGLSSFDRSWYIRTSWLRYPIYRGPQYYGYFGPNFLMEESPPIPEPVTMLGMFLGVSALATYIRKRPRTQA